MNIYERRWEQATRVCPDCGRKFGDLPPETSRTITARLDRCDVCHQEAWVSTRRDYLSVGWWD